MEHEKGSLAHNYCVSGKCVPKCVLGLIQPTPVRACFSQTADAVNSLANNLELVFFF